MRSIAIKTFVLLFVSCLFSETGHSQDGYTVVVRDFETWTSIGLRYKANKKTSFLINQELRLNTNAFSVDQTYTQLSLRYKLNKSFNLGLGTRFILDRGNNDLFDKDFRIHIDAGYRDKIKKFTFKYRLRYQNRNELGLSKDEGDSFKNHLRFKVRTDYKIKNWKLDPIVSAEIYRDLTKGSGSFDKLRLTLGSDYSLKKFGEIGVFYRYERELGVSHPKHTHITGLKYLFTVKG